MSRHHILIEGCIRTYRRAIVTVALMAGAVGLAVGVAVGALL